MFNRGVPRGDNPQRKLEDSLMVTVVSKWVGEGREGETNGGKVVLLGMVMMGGELRDGVFFERRFA